MAIQSVSFASILHELLTKWNICIRWNCLWWKLLFGSIIPTECLPVPLQNVWIKERIIELVEMNEGKKECFPICFKWHKCFLINPMFVSFCYFFHFRTNRNDIFSHILFVYFFSQMKPTKPWSKLATQSIQTKCYENREWIASFSSLGTAINIEKRCQAIREQSADRAVDRFRATETISGDNGQLNGTMHRDTVAAATMMNEAFTVQSIHRSTVNCWLNWLPKARSCPINVSTHTHTLACKHFHFISRFHHFSLQSSCFHSHYFDFNFLLNDDWYIWCQLGNFANSLQLHHHHSWFIVCVFLSKLAENCFSRNTKNNLLSSEHHELSRQ